MLRMLFSLVLVFIVGMLRCPSPHAAAVPDARTAIPTNTVAYNSHPSDAGEHTRVATDATPHVGAIVQSIGPINRTQQRIARDPITPVTGRLEPLPNAPLPRNRSEIVVHCVIEGSSEATLITFVAPIADLDKWTTQGCHGALQVRPSELPLPVFLDPLVLVFQAVDVSKMPKLQFFEIVPPIPPPGGGASFLMKLKHFFTGKK